MAETLYADLENNPYHSPGAPPPPELPPRKNRYHRHTRHTLLSHGIEYEGWSLVQAAQIAGHTSTRMVAETYGHMIDQPKLPEF